MFHHAIAITKLFHTSYKSFGSQDNLFSHYKNHFIYYILYNS